MSLVVVLMANPVNEAPTVVATTVEAFIVAEFALDKFHAEIVPFRLAKTKNAGPVVPMPKEVIFEFATMPVGPMPSPGPGGIAAKFVAGEGKTFAAATPVLPVTEKRLDVPVPWLLIQKGDPPGMAAMPHVFMRFGSVSVASPPMSETRSVCLNWASAVPAPAQSATIATPPVTADLKRNDMVTTI